MEEYELLKDFTILYVEDEETLRNGYKKILSKFFKEVFIASNGEEAIKVFYKKNPDMIVTDIEMPKINGINFIKTIREDGNLEVPILLSARPK